MDGISGINRLFKFKALLWISASILLTAFASGSFSQETHNKGSGSYYERHCAIALGTQYRSPAITLSKELDNRCQQAVKELSERTSTDGTQLSFQDDFINPAAILFGHEPVLRTEPIALPVEFGGLDAVLELQQLSLYLKETYGVEITTRENPETPLHQQLPFRDIPPLGDTTLIIPGNMAIQTILTLELKKTSAIGWSNSYSFRWFNNDQAKEREFARIIKLLTLIQPFSHAQKNQQAVAIFATRVRGAFSMAEVNSCNIPQPLGLSTEDMTHFLAQHGTTSLRDRLDMVNALNRMGSSELDYIEQVYKESTAFLQDPGANRKVLTLQHDELAGSCDNAGTLSCDNISKEQRYRLFFLKRQLVLE